MQRFKAQFGDVGYSDAVLLNADCSRFAVLLQTG
jgi:hypothetical protein